MSIAWCRVETIDGYERTYRLGAFRVAYRRIEPGDAYLHRDLFVDGDAYANPLPPVYIAEPESITDDFYLNSLRFMEWHNSRRIGKRRHRLVAR